MGFLSSIFAGHGVSDPEHFLTRAFAPLTHAGTSVNEHSALKFSAVYACVGIISDAQAQLPIDVVQTTTGDAPPGPGARPRRKVKVDHVVSDLLGEEPNEFMTAMTLRCSLQAQALLWGNGYAEIQRTQGGDPFGLWPLLSDRTHVRSGNGKIWYETNVGGVVRRLEPEDVLHIPALGFDGLKGIAPIAMARQAVGLGLALEEFGAKFFGNDMKSGGFLKHPGRLSKPAQENILDSMDSGLTKAHRLKILEEGMEFQPMTIPPEDAQFIKTREFAVEEIARWYRVPLFMIQSHAKDTSWGTGISEQSLGFLRYTQTPWIIRWEQECNRKLFTEKERADGLGIKHNVNGLLRPDAKGRALFYKAARNKDTGWLELDEVRELEDLNPLGPDGLNPAVDTTAGSGLG